MNPDKLSWKQEYSLTHIVVQRVVEDKIKEDEPIEKFDEANEVIDRIKRGL